MPKLPATKPQGAAAALEKAGFSFARQRGSHRIYIKERLRITVPFHNKDLKKGTLAHIVKQAALTQEEFIDLLEK